MATRINHEEKTFLPFFNQFTILFFEGVIYTSGGSDLTFLFVIDGVLSSSNKLKCFQH